MNADSEMYIWRKLTPDQRAELLKHGQNNHLPWHGPPHYASDSEQYLITAACFEHRPIIGASAARMTEFEAQLLKTVELNCKSIYAWIVLPNHYHLLVYAPDLSGLLKALGLVHGRTSFQWNGRDGCRGRQVWHRAAETGIKSERHFWATLNYVLNNAVHHGYVERWQDWPYSSATRYLEEVGREVAERRWREFPILDFGKDWDIY